jgi:hypothetical protein
MASAAASAGWRTPHLIITTNPVAVSQHWQVLANALTLYE